MTYRINAEGLAQIENFLCTYHKKGSFTTPQLRAADAEFQLDEGNPATIEIRSWDSVTGDTRTFTVPPEGVDFTLDETD